MSSAAKMVADSTQSDLPEKVRKRKKTVVKKKVKKRKETDKRSRKKSGEDYDPSDLDLEKDIKPIGAFVKDREALLGEMFHCVKGASLERNLPDVLKELPVEDLKRRCLEELEVMSKKRIRRILTGDDPGSISSSGTEDDTTEEEEEPVEEDLLEYEGDEVQLADSTSHYTGDSDRDLDRDVGSYDDGSVSMVGSRHSYTPSDGGDMMYTDDQEQYEYNTNENSRDNIDDNIDDQQYGMTEDDQQYDMTEEACKTVDSHEVLKNTVRVRRESDETEEGEVFDDENSSEPVDILPVKVSAESNVESEETKEIKVEPMDDMDQSKDNDGKPEELENNDGATKEESITSSENAEEGVNDEKVETTVDPKAEDETEIKKASDSLQNVETVEQELKTDEKDTDGECVDSDNDESIGKGSDAENNGNNPPKRRIVLPPAESIAPVLTKNQMELLELEMRARAIKAMLKTSK